MPVNMAMCLCCRSKAVPVRCVQADVYFKQYVESTSENTHRQQGLPLHQVLSDIQYKQLAATTHACARGWTPVPTVSRVIPHCTARGAAYQSAAQSHWQ